MRALYCRDHLALPVCGYSHTRLTISKAQPSDSLHNQSESRSFSFSTPTRPPNFDLGGNGSSYSSRGNSSAIPSCAAPFLPNPNAKHRRYLALLREASRYSEVSSVKSLHHKLAAFWEEARRRLAEPSHSWVAIPHPSMPKRYHFLACCASLFALPVHKKGTVETPRSTPESSSNAASYSKFRPGMLTPSRPAPRLPPPRARSPAPVRPRYQIPAYRPRPKAHQPWRRCVSVRRGEGVRLAGYT